MSYFKKYLSYKKPNTTITAAYLAGLVGLERSETCRLWLTGKAVPKNKYVSILEEKLKIKRDELIMAAMIDQVPERYREVIWDIFRPTVQPR